MTKSKTSLLKAMISIMNSLSTHLLTFITGQKLMSWMFKNISAKQSTRRKTGSKKRAELSLMIMWNCWRIVNHKLNALSTIICTHLIKLNTWLHDNTGNTMKNLSSCLRINRNSKRRVQKDSDWTRSSSHLTCSAQSFTNSSNLSGIWWNSTKTSLGLKMRIKIKLSLMISLMSKSLLISRIRMKLPEESLTPKNGMLRRKMSIIKPPTMTSPSKKMKILKKLRLKHQRALVCLMKIAETTNLSKRSKRLRISVKRLLVKLFFPEAKISMSFHFKNDKYQKIEIIF